MSTDPAAITTLGRMLPTRYWKGSGLSLLLDILGTILSGGGYIAKYRAECRTKRLSGFIAIETKRLENYKSIQSAITQIIDDYLSATPIGSSEGIRYSGQQVLKTRAKNLADAKKINQF